MRTLNLNGLVRRVCGRDAREATFEELEPLGIPDLEEYHDEQGARGLQRAFIELLWAAGAGAPGQRHPDALLGRAGRRRNRPPAPDSVPPT